MSDSHTCDICGEVRACGLLCKCERGETSKDTELAALRAEIERLRKELAETRCHGPRECTNYLGMELRLYGAKALAETKLANLKARIEELKDLLEKACRE